MSSFLRGRRARSEGPRATFRQLLPYLFEHRGVLVVVAILSIVGAAATLGQPLIVGQVISRVQAGDGLGLLVWALVALVVVSSVISGYQHYLLQRTGTAVVFSSRRRLIARILHLPISEFDARRTGDLVSRVGTDTTLLYAVLTQGLADAVGNSLIFLGALVGMVLIDPLLLVLILVVLALSIGTVGFLSGRIRRATRVQQDRVGALASGVERAIGSIRTVRASGATERETEAITSQARDAYDAGVGIAKASALVVPIAGVALQVSLLVVLGVGGFRVASGAITVANLVTFVIFLFMLLQPLGTFLGALTSVGQALGALGRIQEVLDLPTETQDDAAISASVRSSTGDEPRGEAPAIEFRDVRFRYPQSVVAARRKTETEALGLLESVRVDTSVIERPAETDAHDGEVLRGVSFSVPAARASRSWGLPGPERARRSRSSSGSTIRRAAPCSSTASTCARSNGRTCAGGSGTSSRTLRPSRARLPTICASHPRARPTRSANACCTPSTSRTSWSAARWVSNRPSAKPGSCSRAASVSGSRSPAPCWRRIRSCCSTSRRRHWTDSTSSGCVRRSTRSPRGARSSSSPTGSRPSSTATSSS